MIHEPKLPQLLISALTLACLVFATAAQGAVYAVGSTVGVMQQPTSHYYHATYGAEATVSTNSEHLSARVSYIERPEFRSDGYADKDYGWFGLVGSKVLQHGSGGLYAFLGGGRMAGYTATTSERNEVGGKSKSSYLQSGIATAVAYAFHFGAFEVAAEHQVFVGFVDKSQVEGYVAWPFTFFQLRTGVTW